MARKRYKTKRQDYRKGGRVRYARGSRPGRRDFSSAEEYNIALEQWKSDPVNTQTRVAGPAKRTAPAPAPAPVKAPPVQTEVYNPDIPSRTGVPSIDAANLRLATPPTGGRPQRRDYESKDAYQQALEQGGFKTQSSSSKNKEVKKTDSWKDKFEEERAKRVVRAGEAAEDIASGMLPPNMVKKPDVRQIDAQATGTQAATEQMDAITPITAETVPTAAQETTAQIEGVAQAGKTLPSGYSFEPGDLNYTQVMPSVGMRYAYGPDGERIEVPVNTLESVTAGTMQPSLVTEPTTVTGVTGTISDDAIADAAQVTETPTINAADVQIEPGALTARVVGTVSPQAMATAAQAAGTTLSRVTRAKRQLRTAGVSEEAITALGNDPEALEIRLMDLTQEERGVIGDLPEEALVSNQLDSLLKGMENGEIPTWASPAVAAVEQMLAQRGLEASTVGQENLFNAIIQSAVPLAQSNAQAIQTSVAQTRDIESREELANAQMRQQTALQNAGNVFQMDMAQFSADQQTALSNSKFLQTVSLTEANNDQQAAIQNALILSQSNLAEANMRQQMAIQNAKTFLTMDMANLNNQQQASMVTAQYQQQTMLSNQAAQNAAAQFNATSENQTNQFMASLNNQINQYNATAINQSKTVNAQMQNAANARNADRINDVNKANAAMLNQTAQFNSQMDFNRNQWNAANRQAVINSNVTWTRQVNTANTAAQNAVNQQNAQNAFTLTREARAFLMQELRDQADYDFKWANNEADRKVNAMIAAASAEGDAAKYWSENYKNASDVIDTIFGE